MHHIQCLFPFRRSCVWIMRHGFDYRHHPVVDRLPRPLLPDCLQAQLHSPQYLLWWKFLHPGGHLLRIWHCCHQRRQVRLWFVGKGDLDLCWINSATVMWNIDYLNPCWYRQVDKKSLNITQLWTPDTQAFIRTKQAQEPAWIRAKPQCSLRIEAVD